MVASPVKMPSSAKPYYAPVDGVRAFCVMLVILNHVPTTSNMGGWFQGSLGVDIFFAISGFLITTLLLREERLDGHIDLSAFYWRRVFRIIPVYLTVLLLYVVVCQLPGFAAKWVQLKAGLPYFLTGLNEYAREPAPGNVFTHTWSLGVEEKFYLVWPVLFFVLFRTLRARRVLVGVLLVLLLAAASVWNLGVSYFGLFGGCLMALALNGESGDRITRWLRHVPGIVAVGILLFAFWLDSVPHVGAVGFDVLMIVFLSHLVVRPGWLSSFFAWKPLVWLGRRSYGMYLVHVLAANAVESRIAGMGTGPTLLKMVITFTISAAMAAVLFVAVEEPARRYGKLFIARRRAAAAPAGSTAAV